MRLVCVKKKRKEEQKETKTMDLLHENASYFLWEILYFNSHTNSLQIRVSKVLYRYF